MHWQALFSFLRCERVAHKWMHTKSSTKGVDFSESFSLAQIQLANSVSDLLFLSASDRRMDDLKFQALRSLNIVINFSFHKMQSEEESISILQAMMGGLDAGVARRALQWHMGDIEVAAAELLDLQATASERSKPSTNTDSWPLNLDSETLPSYAPQRPNTPRTIDRQYWCCTLGFAPSSQGHSRSSGKDEGCYRLDGRRL